MGTRPKLDLRFIQIDSELNAFSTELRPQIAARAERALARGATVTWEDGRTEWLKIVHLVDLGQRGSKMYTWDRSGDKVKAVVFLVTKTKDGKITERKTGTRFVTF